MHARITLRLKAHYIIAYKHSLAFDKKRLAFLRNVNVVNYCSKTENYSIHQ